MNAIPFLCIFLSALFILAHTEDDKDMVQQRASDAGEKLFQLVKNATKFEKLQSAYDGGDFQLKRKDGMEIASDMKRSLEDVLRNKIRSVEMLYTNAESLRENYTYQQDLSLENTHFHEAKFLDTTVEIYETFSSDIAINKSGSVVHIPTDVYKGSVDILNTITWTKGLNHQFKKNLEQKPSLLWQYIGTAKGMYRVFPGFNWTTPNDKDLYDNRRRGWYIQGSSSSKDMVILLDLSGSMVGSNVAIVKLAAMSLLDTLQENDFVNVIVFKTKASLLCDNAQVIEEVGKHKVGKCAHQTLLQATDKNKQYLKDMIPSVKADGEANVSGGFKMALKFLKDFGHNASKCIQTINFFTDGVEKTEEKETLEVLKNENPKGLDQVRVFTYMTGREKGSSEAPLKKFACQNRGYFYKVETLSDVREKVLTYMNVISRPLVLSGNHTESWTPIYLDNSGLGLMITVVAPVFNTTKEGSLLGVVGTDVALPQLQNTVSGYDVGANGYGFAINNNGFILFHPLLKRGVDPRHLVLSELEGEEASTLTREMVDRKTGSMEYRKRVISRISKTAHRISENRTYNYFYTSIDNSSFSSAVAIPTESMYQVVVNETVGDVNDLDKIDGQTVLIAAWRYCDIESDAKNVTPVYKTSYPTADELVRKYKPEKTRCNDSFSHLLFDANLTKTISETWELSDDDRIHSIFLGTSGGLTRIQHRTGSPVPFDRDVLKQEFYERVAGFKSADKIVYYAEHKPAGDADEENSTTLVTASVPIVVGKGVNQTVVAVAGVQLNWTALSSACSSFRGKDCHLIDEDGFVVYSETEEEVGKFFGEVRGPIMKEFISEKLFTRLVFVDAQGVCEVSSDSDGSSAMRLLSPLTAISAYVHWWTQTVIWSLVQISAFFSSTVRVMAEEDGDVKNRTCIKNLYFYKASIDQAFSERYSCDSDCDSSDSKWNLAVAPVDKSNLLLVVNSRNLNCSGCLNTEMPLEREKTDLPPFTSMNDLYRKRPKMTCYKHSDEEDSEKDCGGGSSLSPACLLPLLLVALAVFLVPC